MRALIDGDIILYSVGFASEERYYECSDGMVFPNAKEAKEYCEEIIGDSGNGDFGYRLCREPAEDKVWKGNANTMIDSILTQTGAEEDYTIYLTGKGNFRAEIYPEYKANRKNVDKPLHYQELKDWLIKTRPCEIVNGMEADDALGINQHGTDTVICSLDKDLNMIAGRHFNWNKDEGKRRYSIEPAAADKWFWMQVLMGDSTDNIPGLKGIGPKKAAKILEGIQENSLMYEACLQAWDNNHKDMHLSADLLWIKRNENSTWMDLLDG